MIDLQRVTVLSLCQEYQEYLNRLNGETEESSCAAQLEGELRQLQLEEAALMADLANLKAAFQIRIHIKAYMDPDPGESN